MYQLIQDDRGVSYQTIRSVELIAAFLGRPVLLCNAYTISPVEIKFRRSTCTSSRDDAGFQRNG